MWARARSAPATDTKVALLRSAVALTVLLTGLGIITAVLLAVTALAVTSVFGKAIG